MGMVSINLQTSGDTLYLYVVTTRFDTGNATDADSAPSYRIYRRENGTAVTNGTMALLDSSNTAGFYSEAVSLAGFVPGEYVIYVAATVNSVAGAACEGFAVGVDGILLRTTIATLASQTSFTLTAGPAEDNALNGCVIVIRDSASTDQFAVGVVGDYTGSTKTVTMQTDPGIFTMAVGDYVTVLADRSLKPTVDTRTLDVSTGGEAGVDWANVGSPSTSNNLSGTTVSAVSGAVGSVTGAVGSVTGAVGSVTGNVGGNVVGSVGSVTGNVGGNVTGSVGSVAAGGITASSIADGAIDRATFAADTGLQTVRSNTAQAGGAGTITLDASASASDDAYNNLLIYITGGTGAGQVRWVNDYVGATKVASTVPAWATTPDNTSTFALLPVASVWDETLASHLTAGTTGAALNAAGSAGDPWSTALPGAYGAGTAGYIVGTNLNATVSSRLAPTVAGRTLDVSAGGEAGLDWANVGSPTSTVGLTNTTVGIVSSLASGAIVAASFASAALDAIANAILGYNLASVTGAASRSLLNAVRFLRNKWSISGTTLTVTQEDDTTAAWTAAITTNASAEPITASDPS